MTRPLYDPVVLQCSHPGCARTVMPDIRHVDNLTAGGRGWYCQAHRDEP